MKKIFLFLSIFGLALSLSAQDFNKWSVELGLGVNKPMAPLTGGYLSPSLNLLHTELGARYMLNEKFGAKLDYGFGSFNEVKGQSPSFDTKYSRFNLQGVINLGRVLEFERFTRSFGLLTHVGGGFGRVAPNSNSNKGFVDDVYNMIFGFNPQLKLSDKVVLSGDISTILNGRQTVTWDGATLIRPDIANGFYGANGTWWTGSIGLQVYMGKSKVHADWFIREDLYATKEELKSSVAEIKNMLKDSDSDGVADFLDKEPNTPNGARVNTHGITLDSDSDGTPDHLDRCPFAPGPTSTSGCPIETVKKEVDYLKEAIQQGYVNVYFAFDSSKPLQFSISSINYLANFIKKNPGTVVEIKGYADEIGPENYNILLSERRAKSVYEILLASGISPSSLSFKGYGEDTSVDKNSQDARQLARRVSFEVR